MALQQAIDAVMQARGLTRPDVLCRIPKKNRSTIYRLLSGDTLDARVSTLAALCLALGVTPNDLLSVAGLWNEADPLDLRLRRVFSTVQSLASPYKLVAVTQVERLIGTWQEAVDGSLGREAGS